MSNKKKCYGITARGLQSLLYLGLSQNINCDITFLGMPELGEAIADMGQHANLESCLRANKALLSECDIELKEDDKTKEKNMSRDDITK